MLSLHLKLQTYRIVVYLNINNIIIIICPEFKHHQNWSTSYHILINKLLLNMLTDRLHS